MKLLARLHLEKIKPYYTKKVQDISIPEDPTPAQIRCIDAQIDAAYQRAHFVFCEIESAVKALKRQEDLLKKTGMLLAKDEEEVAATPVMLGGSSHKLYTPEHKLSSREDRASWAGLYANSFPVELGVSNQAVFLPKALDTVEDLCLFMRSVISVLKGKHDRLITATASHKTEASFTSNEEASSTSDLSTFEEFDDDNKKNEDQECTETANKPADIATWMVKPLVDEMKCDHTT